jgi:hypothetical protein
MFAPAGMLASDDVLCAGKLLSVHLCQANAEAIDYRVEYAGAASCAIIVPCEIFFLL